MTHPESTKCRDCVQPVVPRRKKCARHLAMDAASAKKRREANPDRWKQHQSRTIERRRAEGRCRECEQFAVPNRSRCEIHLKRHAAYVSQRRTERVAAGLCAWCGAVPVEGKRHCQPCLDKETERRHRPGSHYNLHGARGVVLDRDGRACRLCGDNTGLELHHIDGKGKGHPNPNHDPSNLITLCRICHRSVSRLARVNPKLAIDLIMRGS